MPVSTQLVRNGTPVGVGGWSWWHLARLQDAMAEERDLPVEDVPMFPKTGSYTFREDHIFSAPEDMIWRDGEAGKVFTFEIKIGDEYRAWR